MTDSIHRQATEDTPAVVLDPEKGIFLLSGRSLPENVNDFYEPILQWFDAYSKNPLKKTVVNVRLEYFCTASSKLLYDLLIKLDDLYAKGYDVTIKWHYPHNDEEIYRSGKEFAEMLDVPFVFNAYDEDQEQDEASFASGK